MRILGIDPGYATIGFGLIEADRNRQQMLTYGAITTPTGLTFPERLRMLYDDMTDLLKQTAPEQIAIEELFFGKNITTGIGVSHGRGVILLACAQAGIPISEYKPTQVKQAVVGYGNASKKQVMEMTQRLLRLESIPRPDDAADALALAVCHARSATSLLSTALRENEG